MKPRMKYFKPSKEAKAAMTIQRVAQKTFLMCRPSFYGIHYQINPWMSLSNQADRALAIEQWDNLRDRILEHGGDVRYIKDRPDLPDMVFTANGATVFKAQKKVAISRFRHEERRGEEEWFVQWFAEEGWDIYYPSAYYEGAGDALYLNGTLVCGTGFRSDAEAHKEIASFCSDPVLVAKLTNPRFYHLDTCFCPLEGGDYLIYPAAFDHDSFYSIEMLQRQIPGSHGIVVVTEEAERFACNAVCIGRTVIMPDGCPQTMELLEKRNYKPVPVEMGEFIKAGGACKCLTLEIG
jgi:N-dimethylarginine dimethylaminohydrolase